MNPTIIIDNGKVRIVKKARPLVTYHGSSRELDLIVYDYWVMEKEQDTFGNTYWKNVHGLEHGVGEALEEVLSVKN